ncbi:hypothetical protein D043_3919A, partial [Vibrio parahaemolyticus EKP-021]
MIKVIKTRYRTGFGQAVTF